MVDSAFSNAAVMDILLSTSQRQDGIDTSKPRRKTKKLCLVCRSHKSMNRLFCRLCKKTRALPSCVPQACYVHHELACRDCLEAHRSQVSDLLISKIKITSIVSLICSYMWLSRLCVRCGNTRVLGIILGTMVQLKHIIEQHWVYWWY